MCAHVYHCLFPLSQYDAKINPDGLLYDCGVELTPEGQFGRQDYVKHATRGTYTLHSLYLLLWANFGAFCMALLTQPEAETTIHGPIISEWLSVRHYCVSQLRTMWMHLRNNLSLSDEERSFFVMRCTKRLYEVRMILFVGEWCPRSQTCHLRQKVSTFAGSKIRSMKMVYNV